MFCPSCGTEERNPSQFCRACGADLRTVRTALLRPDDVTSSAVGAREEIGRAFAERIRGAQTTKDLAKITEDILPEIEKFLESPAEKRLRRLRVGTITAAVGLGAMIVLLTSSMRFPFGPFAGLLVFFIGLGTVLNGLFFTIPGKTVPDRHLDGEAQAFLDKYPVAPAVPQLAAPPAGYNTGQLPPPSVTEDTTAQLPHERREAQRQTS